MENQRSPTPWASEASSGARRPLNQEPANTTGHSARRIPSADEILNAVLRHSRPGRTSDNVQPIQEAELLPPPQQVSNRETLNQQPLRTARQEPGIYTTLTTNYYNSYSIRREIISVTTIVDINGHSNVRHEFKTDTVFGPYEQPTPMCPTPLASQPLQNIEKFYTPLTEPVRPGPVFRPRPPPPPPPPPPPTPPPPPRQQRRNLEQLAREVLEHTDGNPAEHERALSEFSDAVKERIRLDEHNRQLRGASGPSSKRDADEINEEEYHTSKHQRLEEGEILQEGQEEDVPQDSGRSSSVKTNTPSGDRQLRGRRR